MELIVHEEVESMTTKKQVLGGENLKYTHTQCRSGKRSIDCDKLRCIL